MRYIFIITSTILISCNTVVQKKEEAKSGSLNVVSLFTGDSSDDNSKYEFQDTLFELIKIYPSIKDSVLFINELKKNCHLTHISSRSESINYFKKFTIYGSNKIYYLIEYDFKYGSMASFPWKKQILFDNSGKLIHILNAYDLKLINIFKNANPLLL